ncbi:hypothetical protein [Burkholderia plantarii]|uniref:hypothetical protein n=1 Tax=Burkholderia plantarii TaxID=41899 RepID=UPI0018DCE55E|nr:hypothetical protein [Burkholderia plantarii]MBI0325819.1 hypothetical protein [Burkholderia plantarii]
MHNAVDASRLAALPRSLGQFDFSGSVLDDMPSRPFFPAAPASCRPRALVLSPVFQSHRAAPAAGPRGGDACGFDRVV